MRDAFTTNISGFTDNNGNRLSRINQDSEGNYSNQRYDMQEKDNFNDYNADNSRNEGDNSQKGI